MEAGCSLAGSKL